MATEDGWTAVLLVVDGEIEVASGRLEGTDRPDLSVIDALARFQLAARRRGWSIRLSNPPRDLCALLDFAGLSEVAGDVVIDVAALALEARGEAECREQLWIQEVVKPRDPPP